MAKATTFPYDKCYCCGRKLHWSVALIGEHNAWTEDGQGQFVGPECAKKIKCAGAHGYQPALGGPRIYAANPQPAANHG